MGNPCSKNLLKQRRVLFSLDSLKMPDLTKASGTSKGVTEPVQNNVITTDAITVDSSYREQAPTSSCAPAITADGLGAAPERKRTGRQLPTEGFRMIDGVIYDARYGKMNDDGSVAAILVPVPPDAPVPDQKPIKNPRKTGKRQAFETVDPVPPKKLKMATDIVIAELQDTPFALGQDPAAELSPEERASQEHADLLAALARMERLANNPVPGTPSVEGLPLELAPVGIGAEKTAGPAIEQINLGTSNTGNPESSTEDATGDVGKAEAARRTARKPKASAKNGEPAETVMPATEKAVPPERQTRGSAKAQVQDVPTEVSEQIGEAKHQEPVTTTEPAADATAAPPPAVEEAPASSHGRNLRKRVAFAPLSEPSLKKPRAPAKPRAPPKPGAPRAAGGRKATKGRQPRATKPPPVEIPQIRPDDWEMDWSRSPSPEPEEDFLTMEKRVMKKVDTISLKGEEYMAKSWDPRGPDLSLPSLGVGVWKGDVVQPTERTAKGQGLLAMSWY